MILELIIFSGRNIYKLGQMYSMNLELEPLKTMK
nr:MAG TPA: hypothetical protein [Caudoviricetes sp.]